MKTNPSITDAGQRREALDPSRSFIVQAPAGSGKTELLIQRYLVLLAHVRSPEEVIAITFTKKAAAEMQTRVMAALRRAQGPEAPELPHERLTWELARSVLETDAVSGWGLCQNPSRMRIFTIDSLCASLTRQMPILSRFGAQPQIAEDRAFLYAEAAKNTIAELETGTRWSASVSALIRHLDNQLDMVERLVADMLPRRDQWLRHIVSAGGGEGQRKILEQALGRIVSDALADLESRFAAAAGSGWTDLACFAARNLADADMDSPIRALSQIDGVPARDPDSLFLWRAIAELFLTQKGEWRKSADKRIGFPPPKDAGSDKASKSLYAEKKSAFKNLLAVMREEDPSLADALNAVRSLPSQKYTDGQWHLMAALFEILKLSVAHLQLVFQTRGKVDFVEIALRARQALGTPEDPTDLALALDYRIHHILMDEFQDTSISQFELLLQMTAGWMPEDGRTFFAVGDPMQSIYLFREAEVGLFLNVWENGLAGMHLDRLVLSSNFRSDAGIVKWVNSAFPKVLPPRIDATTGAVPYTPSVSVHPEGAGPAVNIHPIIDGNAGVEAAAVATCIVAERAANPAGRIAVLVRGRGHLKAIIPAIRQQGWPFRAVEIDSLEKRPIVMDLLSLTRALSHPADRIAWLAVLRAPWCGLTLNDLFSLTGDAHACTLNELVHDEKRLSRLSPDGKKRLARFRTVMDEAMESRRDATLRCRVARTWLKLGGPACALSAADLADVRSYLDFLDQRVGFSTLTDYTAFESAVAELFAQPDPLADDRLQIMTIHKAKGLEFETVILPGLEKFPPSESPRLLLWLERSDAPDDKRLLLAPIAETGTEKDPTYQYIRALEEKKRDFEAGRLLYVAATRAKKRLHLFGRLGLTKEGRVKPPKSKSLLSRLWPVVGDWFEAAENERKPPANAAEPEASDSAGEIPIAVPHIRRLSMKWEPPPAAPDIEVKPMTQIAASGISTDSYAESPLFDWAGVTVRHVGTVVHRWLHIICIQGIDNWTAGRIAAHRRFYETDLKRVGVADGELSAAVIQVETALKNTVGDPKGRWILTPHTADACEYAISGYVDGGIINAVIDRTFIDENGTRWVIDYKSGTHKGGGREAFLAREQDRYERQMTRYARLMKKMEDRSVRLALYYPMLCGWREWGDDVP